MASIAPQIPLPLPDKGGQGALYDQVQRLTKAMAYHAERGEQDEVKRVEAKLDAARTQWLKLYNGKVQHA